MVCTVDALKGHNHRPSWVRCCIIHVALHNKTAVVISSAVPDLGSAEQAPAVQKRKAPSPPHSSNGHSPSDTSPSPAKKKKKPGLINNKDQVCSLLGFPLIPMTFVEF